MERVGTRQGSLEGSQSPWLLPKLENLCKMKKIPGFINSTRHIRSRFGVSEIRMHFMMDGKSGLTDAATAPAPTVTGGIGSKSVRKAPSVCYTHWKPGKCEFPSL